jgi:hypothetical protein
MDLEDLGVTERELVALFLFGFVLGLVVIEIAEAILEAWVIESDQADRRRMREELERWWSDQVRLEREAAELAHDQPRQASTVGKLTGEASS